MNSASKVAEIFESAGMSFSRLGAMTMELQHQRTRGRSEEGKWGDEEIGMLRAAVLQFGNDIDKICEHMKSKSVAQIRTALKRKAVQQKADSSAKSDGPPTTPTTGFQQGVLDNTIQTPRTSQDDQDGKVLAKRLKIDDKKSTGAIDTQDTPQLTKSGQVNNSSIIESAFDKLKYESKDSHEIDIEG